MFQESGNIFLFCIVGLAVLPPHLLLRALLCSAIRCVEVLELSSFLGYMVQVIQSTFTHKLWC